MRTTKPLFKIGHILSHELPDPSVCFEFGCGNKLSLIETLAGKKCTACMGKNKVDIMKIIKLK